MVSVLLLVLGVLAAGPCSLLAAGPCSPLAAGTEDLAGPPPCDGTRFPLPAHCRQIRTDAGVAAAGRSSNKTRPSDAAKLGTLDAICDSYVLGTQITSDCLEGVSTRCCEAVLAAVDMRGCLCSVMDESSIHESQYGVKEMVQMYLDCGGVRQLKKTDNCKDVSDASPPPPGGASKEMQKTMQRLEIGTLALQVFGVVVLGVAVVFVLYLLRNMQGRKLYAMIQELASNTTSIRQLAGLPPPQPLAALPGQQQLWVKVFGEILLGAARALGVLPQAPSATAGTTEVELSRPSATAGTTEVELSRHTREVV